MNDFENLVATTFSLDERASKLEMLRNRLINYNRFIDLPESAGRGIPYFSELARAIDFDESEVDSAIAIAAGDYDEFRSLLVALIDNKRNQSDTPLELPEALL